MQLRFEDLPQSAVDRVLAAPADDLDRWFERILHTERLDELR